jgi:hypothetical protein
VNLDDQSRPGEGGSETIAAVSTTISSVAANPPYQLLPPLTDDEYAALKADIQTNGVLVPVIVDQHGAIIDGHHRAKIAAELGVPCERKVREFASDEERYEFALGLNLKRRDLNREQMRQLIASECERTPAATDREIARRLGCSHRTVAAVRRPPDVDKLSTQEAWIEDIDREIHANIEANRRDGKSIWENSLWRQYMDGQVKVNSYRDTVAVERSLSRTQVWLAREIRDHWEEFKHDAPYDSWPEAVRETMHIDPYRAVFEGLIDDDPRDQLSNAVDNLPTLSRAEAEALTESIQRHLAEGDREIAGGASTSTSAQSARLQREPTPKASPPS